MDHLRKTPLGQLSVTYEELRTRLVEHEMQRLVTPMTTPPVISGPVPVPSFDPFCPYDDLGNPLDDAMLQMFVPVSNWGATF